MIIDKIREFIISRKTKKIFKLEIEYGNLEERIDEKISEVDKICRKIIKKENEIIPIICPFCNQYIDVLGGHVAKCELCEFSVGLSTVSEQQDEYILYHSWLKKPRVIVKIITKEESYRGRYIRASTLNDVLKDETIVDIGNAWRNGIVIEK